MQSEHSNSHLFRTAPYLDIYKQIIAPSLQKIAHQKYDVHNLLRKVKEFYLHSHNVRRKSFNSNKETVLKFNALVNCYGKNNDLVQIYGQLAKFILEHEPFEFPILQSGTAQQLTLTKSQVCYLLGSMALNIIPPQFFDKDVSRASKFPFFKDFTYIFGESVYKTRTIMEYFRHFFTHTIYNKQQLNEKLSIRRQIINEHIEEIIDKKSNLKMSEFQVTSNETSIEDFYGSIKVDFANKFIGGGVLHGGCVQQEIMFANHPEILTSLLFCEVMKKNEALFFTGFKKYSKNKGYGWNTSYGGQEDFKQINYDYDEKNRPKEYIVAIDALHFSNQNSPDQVSKAVIDRQILKAYTGFNVPESKKVDIVTGNWGCGAFNGEIKTKFLIQWIACSLAGRKMVYCPFGARGTILQNQVVLDKLMEMKVGQVYRCFVKGASKMKSMKENIFEKMEPYM